MFFFCLKFQRIFTEPWTPYWSHIEEGWERRNENNLLFLFYEEMNKVGKFYFVFFQKDFTGQVSRACRK